MQTPELLVAKCFTVKKEHIQYLNSINPDNDSVALRIALDRLITMDKTPHIRNFSKYSTSLIILSLGCIFLINGYSMLLNGGYIPSFIISVCLGLFLLFYDLLVVVMDYKVQ